MNSRDESTLFADALALPDEDRAAFLESACTGDPAMRRRLDALLAAHAEPDTRLAGATNTAQPAHRIEFTREPAEEAVGQRLGRFKLLEKLGEGGCGVVYAAEQTEPVRRRVALKVIKLGMDTKQVVARFEAERQALAIMDHPNIAKVLDAGTTEQGRPYFVMELVRGIPITTYCDQTNLPMRERLDLFVKVCHAIQHAHQKGIIHRDIKPSNILVTLHDGVPVPKVIDFGIAKATEGRLTDATVYTQLHQFVGTPAYMSPEQAEMSGLDIDTRSDIYSLGVLLYELLSGRTPFDAKELVSMGLDAMRRTIREKEPVRPSTRLATLLGEELTTAAKHRSADTANLLHLLKGDLDWIVMKCLEKDRQRRYETANGLAADIVRHLTNEPVVARPPSAVYKFQKAWRRNRLVFNAGAAVAWALLLGIMLTAWQASRARALRDLAEQSQKLAEAQQIVAQTEARRANSAEQSEKELRVIAEQQALAARRKAYAADMRLCQQALAVNNLREARQLLDRQRPTEGQTDLRGWEWRHLWQRCQPVALFELGTHRTRVLSAIHVDGGRSLMTYEDGGRLSRWNMESRVEEAVLQQGEPSLNTSLRANSGHMAISGDGEWVAAVGRKTDDDTYVARIWDLRPGTLIAELPIGVDPAHALTLSPDRKSLVTFVAVTETATFWNIAQQVVSREIRLSSETDDQTRNQQVHGAVRYSPDAAWLAIGGGSDRVYLLETKTGAVREIPVAGHGDMRTLEFSPDSRQLAVGRGFVDPNVRILDVATGAIIHTLAGHRGFISKVAFSPDGSLLASASGDQTVKLWDTGTWEERTTLRGHTDEVWSVDFAPDNRTLVSGAKDGHVYVWPVTGVGQREDSILLPDPDPTSVDAAPDGKRFVTISEGVVYLWGPSNFIHPELGTNNVAAAWVAPDEILLGTANPPQIRAWNLGDQTVAAFPLKSRAGTPGFVYLPVPRVLVAMVRDDNRDESTFTRWDVATRRELSSCVIPGGQVRRPRTVISQDSRSLAVPRSHGKLEIYDLTTGRVRSTLDLPTNIIQGMALTPDGTRFACANLNSPQVEIWDVAGQRKHVTLSGHNLVASIQEFSPDGRRLISSTIGTEPLRLWDTEGWQTVFSFEPSPETYLWNPRHLSDGNTIAFREGRFAVGRNWIRLWQAPSWEEIKTVESKTR